MKQLNFKAVSVEWSQVPGYGSDHLFQRLAAGNAPAGFPFFEPSLGFRRRSDQVWDRAELAGRLVASNAALGNPLESEVVDAIEKDGLFVVTGQQPVLLGGPAYTLLKAASVISACKTWQPLYRERLIPAFWIAGEDHDILEVNRVNIQGKQLVCKYHDAIATNRVPPVGRISLTQHRDRILEFFKKEIPDQPIKAGVMEQVANLSFRNYTAGFASVLRSMFPDENLVLIDPEAFRPLMQKPFRQIVSNWDACEAGLKQGADILQSQGFQAPLTDLNLFYIRDGFRTHLDLDSQDVREKILDELETWPERFSPGAALRCVIQDTVFPVLVYVGGPSELLYQWQAEPIFQALGVDRARLFPRISATFAEPRILQMAESLGWAPEAVFQVKQLLAEYPPSADLKPPYSQVETAGNNLLTAMTDLANPPPKWMTKMFNSIQFQLQKFGEKALEEQWAVQGYSKDALANLYGQIMPKGKLQERELSGFDLLLRFGPDFIHDVIMKLKPDCLQHQLVIIGMDP